MRNREEKKEKEREEEEKEEKEDDDDDEEKNKKKKKTEITFQKIFRFSLFFFSNRRNYYIRNLIFYDSLHMSSVY